MGGWVGGWFGLRVPLSVPGVGGWVIRRFPDRLPGWPTWVEIERNAATASDSSVSELPVFGFYFLGAFGAVTAGTNPPSFCSLPFQVMLDVAEFSLDFTMLKMPDGRILRQRLWGSGGPY